MMNTVLQSILWSLMIERCPLSHPWPWNMDSCKERAYLIVIFVKLRAKDTPCCMRNQFLTCLPNSNVCVENRENAFTIEIIFLQGCQHQHRGGNKASQWEAWKQAPTFSLVFLHVASLSSRFLRRQVPCLSLHGDKHQTVLQKYLLRRWVTEPAFFTF